MEKYKLGENIIITTTERYEKEFKTLGYTPYNKNIDKVEEPLEQEKVSKRKRKED